MTRLKFHYDAFKFINHAEIDFDNGQSSVRIPISDSATSLVAELMRAVEEYEVDDMVLSIPDIFKDKINKSITNYSNKKVEVHFI